MIVVWVNKRNWKTPGPIVNMALHNAASFSDLGYETHLCIGEGEPSHTDEDLKHFYGLPGSEHLSIHRVPRYRLWGSTYSVSVFFYAHRLIKELARKDTVAVFTRESGFLFFLGSLCRKHKNIVGFYELHDLYADLSWVEKKQGAHRREWLYEHLLLPKISGIVCITRDQEKRYNAIFPIIPSKSFPLGTDPFHDIFSPEEKRKRRTLMYVGHLHGDKGVHFLLSAAKQLAKEEVRLLFLGGKPEKIAKMEKDIEAQGLSLHIRLLPFQPPIEMHRTIAAHASIGIVMLKDTYYNRHLTCPVKALDYLSHGIPVIGSDIPSVHEVLEDAGTYIPPDQVDEFVKAVLDILNDPHQYARMVALSQERARHISWRMRARTLSEFAQNIAVQKNPPDCSGTGAIR